MKRLIVFIFWFPIVLIGQTKLTGYVLEEGSKQPVFGAVIVWENTNSATISDDKGFFEIPIDSTTNILVVSYMGYQTRKFEILEEREIVVTLEPSSSDLEVVEIHIEKPSTNISMYSTIKVEELGQKALEKAACCNLSESFETNPTVDASFTDAVTGTKQIQLLGLAGPYALITTGNIPSVNGNSAITGLNFIPGQWLGGIQLMKGTGSVVNGYNAVSGQINTEYKHLEDFKLFLNGYVDGGTRSEINLIVPINSDNWKRGVFLQADQSFEEMDNNSDGFIDNQIGSKIVAMYLTRYENDSSNWENQTAVKFDYLDKNSGQLSSFENPYLFENNQIKIDAWSKTGYSFNEPGRSTGLQTAGFLDRKDMIFGNRVLEAEEARGYVNFIYADIISSTIHSYKTGVSYSVSMIDNSFDSLDYAWTEHVPGVFGEYSFVPNQKASVVVGARLDYSSLFGLMYSPRFHARWELGNRNVFRSTFGMSSKTPNPLLENFGALASSRQVVFGDFQLERAVSSGVSYTKKWEIKKRTITFSTDFYHTYFLSKMIANFDLNSQEIHFYSLENGSYSNSFMTQVIAELFEGFTFNAAYRWYDVQSKFLNDEYSQQPLNPVHRVFGNLEWQVTPKWNVDYTLVWNGSARIPELNQHPDEYKRELASNSFFVHHAQVKWTATKNWEAYIGTENLFNFQQPNPIVSSDDPFNEFFDASLIWGPIFGRMIYGGFRFEF
jgi:hypothetical protein